MTRAQILSTGHYVPERVVTNADWEKTLGEPVDAWLRANVGIAERRYMADDQATSDLVVEAARVALTRAGTPAEEVDLLIVATDTPDYISPATATVAQHKLGAKRAGTFDVNAACSGWVTALDMAAKAIADDDAYQRVLVVGAYGMSRYIDPKDKRTATLFADGAGAVVLGPATDPGRGFLASKLIAFGEHSDALGVFDGGVCHPARGGVTSRVQFVKPFPKTFNTEHWPPLMADTLAKASRREGRALGFDDVDQYYFTQLNLRTIQATLALIGQPEHKTHWIMDKWGYTGSACIPMALDDAIAQGKGPRPGDLVMFCASGGGLTMAASLWRY